MNEALIHLFNRLNQKGIKYFLLTDFESKLTSKDIDLFVHPASKDSFTEELFESGWYKRKESTYHINHHFYFSIHSSIYLDVKFDLTFANGINNCSTYIYTDDALQKAYLNDKGINRPDGYNAILLYAAHLAYKERGKLEEKHTRYLTSMVNQYEVSEKQLPHLINQIKNSLKRGFSLDGLELKNIIQPFFFHEPKIMVRRKNKFNVGWGAKVLFLGTDGAGKTTLIKAVKEKLIFKNKQLYLGTGEDGWTSPKMKKYLRYEFKNRIINRAYNFFKGYLLFPIEFLLRILPIKAKSRFSVVLIDRVPGTVYLEKKSGKKLLYRTILPKPDLVFFLYADPAVLQKRKPGEVTFERSEADNFKFRKVAEAVSKGKYISIDTSHLTIVEARDIILTEIYKNRKVYDNLLSTKLN